MVMQLAEFYHCTFDYAADTYDEYSYWLMRLKKASDNAVEKYIIRYLKDHPNK